MSDCTKNRGESVTTTDLPPINPGRPTVSPVRRLCLLVSALALTLTACASPGEGAATTADGVDPRPTTTTIITNTTSVQESDAGTTVPDDGAPTSTTDDATGTTSSGRPTAADFTLDLGNGGSYTLSEGEKPVFLVFWAEW